MKPSEIIGLASPLTSYHIDGFLFWGYYVKDIVYNIPEMNTLKI